MSEINYRDIQDLQGMAVREYVDLPPNLVLPGMGQGNLSELDRRALSWLQAAMTILGRKGLLKPDVPVIGTLAKSDSVWDEG